MSWHIFSAEDFECPECQASFIPFEEAQPCPRCKTIASEHFEFVDEVVAGMRIHKNEYGSYTAPAYFVGSTAESVFHWVCRWLDTIEQQREVNELTIAAMLDNTDWGEHKHMQKYYEQLLGRVAQKLAQDESSNTNDVN